MRIRLFEARTFDMEQLVPWFQEIVRPLAPATSAS